MEDGWSMPPLNRIQRCLLCPCGAGTCRLMTSSTSANPGRRFYKCPAPEQCGYGTNGFFKWADSVKANEFIDVPYCGGCMAGPCRVRLEMKGPSSGRILFMCAIKEGQGSCGYRVFQDELEMSLRRAQVNSTTTSPPPMTSTNCNGSPPPKISLVDENIPIKNIQDDQSSVTSTSLRPKSRRTTSTITTSPISVCNAEPENGVNPFPIDHHETLHHHETLRNEPFEKNKFNSASSDSVTKAFRFAAEQLQNDLFTLLEKTDAKDHETMKQDAEATFAALDHLCIDYHHFEKRVNEFISRSISLAAIEQSMVRNVSYQESELQCKFERMKLDEMEYVHTKAVDNVIRSRKSLEVLQDVICSAKEWLFQVEAEYLSSELELKDMEVQLERNFAEKRVLEGKYLIASKELEDFTGLHKQLEAAKAEYDRAKALLRG